MGVPKFPDCTCILLPLPWRCICARVAVALSPLCVPKECTPVVAGKNNSGLCLGLGGVTGGKRLGGAGDAPASALPCVTHPARYATVPHCRHSMCHTVVYCCQKQSFTAGYACEGRTGVGWGWQEQGRPLPLPMPSMMHPALHCARIAAALPPFCV